MSQRIFTTDCEGPISKNDNAHELASRFIPDGDDLFPKVSKYDDVQADVVNRSNYKAGDTLRLIAPFLKAYKLTDKEVIEYSRDNILLVPGAKETLTFIGRLMPSAIISTSYEQYIRALCDVIDFPFENTYCTKMSLDQYKITEDERTKLEDFVEEITMLPKIEIPASNQWSDFSEEDKKTVKRMDEIFFEEMTKMKISRMLKEINPIGGSEKANAVRDYVSRQNGHLQNIIYFGDSITDVDVFRLVNENGGLTVSFNGNAYAIREAVIAVLSNNTDITADISQHFFTYGKEEVFDFIKRQKPTESTRVEIITDENRERLAKESSEFRKTVRGKSIGELG
jgi:energy-converting hydrogenase A subunit R